MKRVTPVIFAFLTIALTHADTVSPLFSRGYTVMPEPQVVQLGAADFVFGSDWRLEVQGASANDVAVEELKEEVDNRFRVKLSEARRGGSVLRLTMAPGSVSVGK